MRPAKSPVFSCFCQAGTAPPAHEPALPQAYYIIRCGADVGLVKNYYNFSTVKMLKISLFFVMKRE